MYSTLLRTRELRKVYRFRDREIEVLRGIDFELKEGAFVSIMGPSGVGKSTFLHLIGLLDTPTGGTVEVMGREAPEEEEERAKIRNLVIGFVFQHHYLLPEFSALENVAIPCLIGGMEEEEALSRAKRMLELVGLGNRIEHRPSELSGGELQRVAIARALVKEPKVVIADEPTGNLDKDTGRSIAQLMVEINREKGTAFVVATHDEELASVAEEIYLLRDGRLRLREVRDA